MKQVAALFVMTDGPYFGIPQVDPWDRERDARTYAGPHKQHLSTMATYRTKEDRQAAYARGEKLPKRPVYSQRIRTPETFRDLLLGMAATATFGFQGRSG